MAGTLGLAVLETAVDTSGLDKGLGESETKAENAGKGMVAKLGGAMGGLATVGVAAGAAVVAGVAAVGVAAIDVGSQVKQAANDMQAALGVSADEASRLADVAKNVFGNNFGGSIEEAAGVVAEARMQLGALADDELQRVSEAAFALNDVFGIDYAESLNSAKALTENFGLSSQQAMDLITSGMQNGLNASGDFLDSIGEYSGLFADAGFSADQMYSIMATGAEAGVLGTDKIADAVKEMGIILNEGGPEVEAAFSTIGLSFDEIAAQVASGQANWGDYFDQIVGGINGIEDPMARSQAQVAIFGTMAEDLGVSFTEGLSSSTASLEEMAGATESMNAKYDNLGSVMEGFKRQALLALEPLGTALLNLANEIMPVIETGFEWFSDNVMPIVTGALEGLVDFIGQVIDGLESGQDPIDAFTGALEGLIPEPVLTAVQTLVDIISNVFTTELENARLLVAGFSAGLQGDFGTLFENIGTIVQNKITLVVDVFGRLAGMVGPALANLGNAVVSWFQSQDWGALATRAGNMIVTGLMKLGSMVGPALATFFRVVANWFRSVDWPGVAYTAVTAILTGLKFLVVDLPPLLAEWAQAFWDWITSYDWLALATSIINGLVEGLQTAGPAVLDALTGIAEGAVSAVKDFFGIQSPSTVFAAIGFQLMAGLADGIENNMNLAGDAIDTAAANLALQGAEAFANALTAVANSIQPAIDALNAIADFSGKLGNNFSKIDSFKFAVERLVQVLAESAWWLKEGSGGHALTLAQDMARTISSVGESISIAIDAMNAIADFSTPANMRQTLDSLVEAIEILVSALVDVAAKMEAEALAHAEVFASAANALVDLVEPAIDAIMAIPEYVRAVGFGDAVAVFANDLTVVIETLAQAFERYLTPIQQAVENAGELAEAASSIVDVIGPALEIINGFASYVRAESFGDKVAIFANDLTVVIETLAAAFERYLTPIRTAVENAGEMADAVNEIVSVVEPGFEVLALFAGDFQRASLDKAVENFARDLTHVAKVLATAFSEAFKAISGAALREAARFAELVAEISRHTADALKAIDDIATAVLPDISAPMAYIIETAQALVNALVAAGPIVNGRLARLAALFKDNVLAIIADLLAAFDALREFAAGGVPGSLQAILNQMVAKIATAAVPAREAAMAIARAIQDVLNTPAWLLIGRNIAYGIAQGLRDGMWAIEAAARTAVNAAIAAAQAELRIASPSQRGADEIGLPFVQGIAEGIARAGEVRTAVTQLVNVAMPQMVPQPALAGAGGWPEQITLQVEGRIENEAITITRQNGVMRAARARGMR